MAKGLSPVWKTFRNTSSILVMFFWKLLMLTNNTRELQGSTVVHISTPSRWGWEV